MVLGLYTVPAAVARSQSSSPTVVWHVDEHLGAMLRCLQVIVECANPSSPPRSAHNLVLSWWVLRPLVIGESCGGRDQLVSHAPDMLRAASRMGRQDEGREGWLFAEALAGTHLRMWWRVAAMRSMHRDLVVAARRHTASSFPFHLADIMVNHACPHACVCVRAQSAHAANSSLLGVEGRQDAGDPAGIVDWDFGQCREEAVQCPRYRWHTGSTSPVTPIEGRSTHAIAI